MLVGIVNYSSQNAFVLLRPVAREQAMADSTKARELSRTTCRLMKSFNVS